MKKSISAAMIAGFLTTGAASASTMTVTWQNSSNAFGYTNYSNVETINVTSPGVNGNVYAGEFQLTGDNGFGNFAAFCVDIYEQLKNPDTYQTPANLFAGTPMIRDNISKLFNTVYSTVDTALEKAAFQVALWEIIYDNGSAFDLDAGAFSTSGNNAVETLAGNFLTGLNSTPTGSYKLTYMFSDGGQDLVTASPVPLPASSLLLVAGIGGLVAMRRRKTA